MKKILKPSDGFTLLEVLITITILATLATLSSQTIQRALKTKLKIQTQVDEVSRARDAMRIIERDVNMAFHYTDMEKEIREAIRKKQKELLKQNGSTTGAAGTSNAVGGGGGASLGAALAAGNGGLPGGTTAEEQKWLEEDRQWAANRRDPETHFMGKDNQMSFFTMNANRINSLDPQADFVKVGYAITSCQATATQDAAAGNSNCLMRRSTNIADGDPEKGGDEIALLNNVEEFKLRYFGFGKQDYVSDWNSKTGDGGAKGKFPDAVEVSLKVAHGEGDKKRTVSMQMVIPIRFTNNPNPQKSLGQSFNGQSTSGGNTTSGTSSTGNSSTGTSSGSGGTSGGGT